MCDIDGCNRNQYALGYCDMHYKRLKRTGKACSRSKFDSNRIILKGNLAFIELYDRNNQVVAHAIIDIECANKVSKYKWHLSVDGYVSSKSIGYLHHLIYGNPNSGYVVDHRNRDKKDCRKENLRLCKHYLNNHNSKSYSNNTSGCKGVRKKKDRWNACIRVDGVHHNLGWYDTYNEAVKARRKGERKLLGDFAPA